MYCKYRNKWCRNKMDLVLIVAKCIVNAGTGMPGGGGGGY